MLSPVAGEKTARCQSGQRKLSYNRRDRKYLFELSYNTSRAGRGLNLTLTNGVRRSVWRRRKVRYNGTDDISGQESSAWPERSGQGRTCDAAPFRPADP